MMYQIAGRAQGEDSVPRCHMAADARCYVTFTGAAIDGLAKNAVRGEGRGLDPALSGYGQAARLRDR